MIFSIAVLLPLICLCNFDHEWGNELNSYKNTFKSELDDLTRLLCEAGKVFRGEKKGPSVKLKKWWADHQKRDNKK